MIETQKSAVKAGLRVGVVGAGVIGATLADALAQRGAHVTLVDPALGQPIDAVPRAVVHPATGRRAAISHRRLAAFDQARAYTADLLSAGGWWPTGVLRVTADDAQAELWRGTAERWPEELSWLDVAAVRARVPASSPALLGGLFVRRGYTLDGRVFVARARLRSRARRVSRAPTKLTWDAREVRLGFADGALGFDAVVLACGPAAAGLLTASSPAFAEVPGEVVRVTMPPPALPFGVRGQVIPDGPDGAWWSASHHPTERGARVRAHGLTQLRAAAIDALPAAAGALPARAWAGVRVSTVDKQPWVARVDTRVWACTAFAGKGFSAGVAAAIDVAERVTTAFGVNTGGP